MKKVLLVATMALTCAVLMTACNSKKFKTGENGVLYRFEEINKSGEQPQVGDLLVGELILLLEDDTIFSNAGNPDRIFQVAEQCIFKGDIQEGLLMMHKGDKAVFKIPADSISKFMPQMPESYEQGKGQYFYYQVSLMDIVTKEDLAQEQANFIKEMEQRKADEPAAIAKYIADNNITVKPTADSLYVLVTKKGTGAKVAAGKKISVDYTGRLLDGTLFDTSREADAKAADKYQEGREYGPIEYVVGEQPMIKGWEEGIMGQPAGSEITLVIPSSLAYGGRGAGKDIMPYTPITFNLTIVSVE